MTTIRLTMEAKREEQGDRVRIVGGKMDLAVFGPGSSQAPIDSRRRTALRRLPSRPIRPRQIQHHRAPDRRRLCRMPECQSRSGEYVGQAACLEGRCVVR